MNINMIYNKRKTIFEKIENTSIGMKIMMSFLTACFTGIMAQIIIPLPFTPIPITAQIFAVLTAGLILGKKYGALSQIFYLIIGICFIPWFSNMTGGIEVIIGSHGGYLLGFILASYFIGYASEKNTMNRKWKKMSVITSFATFGCIYIPGLIGLTIVTYLTQGTLLTIPELLIIGVIPFILGDIIKIFAATSVSKVFLPKN